ncbi:MAG: transposase [Methanospirillaceae archaeon]|nr:transposase [Methanospirillaceae archaeon]
MSFVRIQKDIKNQPLRLYRGNCAWCPIHLSCTKASHRAITRHPQEELKDEMRARLATPVGKKEYAKRITVSEALFGNLKVNKHWMSLRHRGKKKVKGERILHAIGHNLGVICSRVPIEQVRNLESVNFLTSSWQNQKNDGFCSPFDSRDRFIWGPTCGMYNEYEHLRVRFGNPGWSAGASCTL